MSNDAQMNGSLNLPEFEDRLWAELAEVHAEESAAQKKKAGPSPLSGSSGRARSRLLVAASVLAIGALVGAGVVVAARDDGTEPADVAAEGGDGEPSESAGEEGAAAEDTDGDWERMIVYTETDSGFDGGVNQRWEDEAAYDHRSRAIDEEGNPATESFVVEDGSGGAVERIINHREQIWFEAAWIGPRESGEIPEPEDRSPQERHEEAVANGTAVEEGLEEVDGKDLLRVADARGREHCGTNAAGDEVCGMLSGETLPGWVCAPEAFGDHVEISGEQHESEYSDLKEQGPEQLAEMVPDGGDPATDASVMVPELVEPDRCVPLEETESGDPVVPPEHGTTWLDPETYRPVRRESALGPGREVRRVETFEYLERTEENLALLEPEIPEGYTEVDPSEGHARTDFG